MNYDSLKGKISFSTKTIYLSRYSYIRIKGQYVPIDNSQSILFYQSLFLLKPILEPHKNKLYFVIVNRFLLK